MKLKDFDFRIWDNGQKYAGDVVKKYMGLQGFSVVSNNASVIAIIQKIDVEVIGNIHENAELLKGAE